MSQTRQQLTNSLKAILANCQEKKSFKKRAAKIIEEFETLEASFAKADQMKEFVQASTDICERIDNLALIAETSEKHLPQLIDQLLATRISFATLQKCGEQIARITASLPELHLYAGQLDRLITSFSATLLDKKELKQLGKMAAQCSKLYKKSDDLHTINDALFTQIESMKNTIADSKNALISVKDNAQDLHETLLVQKKCMTASMGLIDTCLAHYKEVEDRTMQGGSKDYMTYLSTHQNHFSFFLRPAPSQSSASPSPAPNNKRTPTKV